MNRKSLILWSLIIIILSHNTFSQVRALSNEQLNLISQRETIKSNKIKVQYIALLPPSSTFEDTSAFSRGILVKVIKFDTDGRIQTQSEYESTEDSTTTRYEYYNDGYIKSLTKTAAAANTLITSFTYDSAGRYSTITSSGAEYREYELIYDKKGNLIRKNGFTYYPKTDKQGNVIESERDRILVDIYEFKYDKQNNLLEERIKSNGRLLSTTRYKYGKNKQKLNEQINFLGNKVKINYIYDDNLKLVGYVKINIDGSKSFYKAEYEYYQ